MQQTFCTGGVKPCAVGVIRVEMCVGFFCVGHVVCCQDTAPLPLSSSFVLTRPCSASASLFLVCPIARLCLLYLGVCRNFTCCTIRVRVLFTAESTDVVRVCLLLFRIADHCSPPCISSRFVAFQNYHFLMRFFVGS